MSFAFSLLKNPMGDRSKLYESEKKAKIRSRYHQVPYLTKDTTWENDKNTRTITYRESQEASHFKAGDHKAAMKSQVSMTDGKP